MARKKNKKIKMTASWIKAVKPGPIMEQFSDMEQRGLFLRVWPSGEKTWCVVWKRDHRVRRLTLGKFGDIPLADARDRAHNALKQVSAGVDPQVEKVERREAGTFGELADLYIEQYSQKEKKSWPEDKRQLDAYVKPEWENLKAAAITQDDVELLLDRIKKRGPVQANRTRALIRHMFTWTLQNPSARKKFALKANPSASVARPLKKEKPRKRVFSNDELKAIWTACDSDAVGMVGKLFQLQLLTAARKGELVTMEWSELDLGKGIWTQPDSKTKNGKLHLVPLCKQAVRIIKALRESQDDLENESKRDSKFVFFSSRTGAVAMTWLQKAADRVKTESKVEDFRAHDLRRTAGTRLAKAGVPHPVRKMILNHSLGKDVTEDVYNAHDYWDERKKALDAWARHLMVIVSGLKEAAAATQS